MVFFHSFLYDYQRVVGFYGDISDILCQLIILFSNISGIISDIFNEISWQF